MTTIKDTPVSNNVDTDVLRRGRISNFVTLTRQLMGSGIDSTARRRANDHARSTTRALSRYVHMDPGGRICVAAHGVLSRSTYVSEQQTVKIDQSYTGVNDIAMVVNGTYQGVRVISSFDGRDFDLALKIMTSCGKSYYAVIATVETLLVERNPVRTFNI